MAISIDWGTSVIFVPRADMTLVQTVPTEIRELDINAFRFELKALEASIEGMPFPDTHSHNTEVSLGGLTFARVVEILDPYSITFQDAQYAVNLTGANSNIGDKVNVNQVSVRSQNSAGLISTPLIEFASFEGGVWVDQVNGVTGTIFPKGTKISPVDNFIDAKLIADYRGLNVYYCVGDVLVDSGQDYTKNVFEGQTNVNNTATISSSAIVNDAVFRDLTVTGTLDGGNEIVKCIVSNLSYINGHIHDSGLEGTIVLGGGLAAMVANCFQISDFIPIVNMGGSGQDLIMPNYSGDIRIENLTGSSYAAIGLLAGNVILNSATVTSGTVSVGGNGALMDENGIAIVTGTWNGVTIYNKAMSDTTIALAVASEIGTEIEYAAYNGGIWVDVITGTSGTTYPLGTPVNPVSNITDALTIAVSRGFKTINIVGDYTFPNGTYVVGYTFVGSGFQASTFTFEVGSILALCQMEHAKCTGFIIGVIGFTDSHIHELGAISPIPSSQHVIANRCLLTGTLSLPDNYSGTLKALDCWSGYVEGKPAKISMGYSTANVLARNYSGPITIGEVDEDVNISIDLSSGELILENTVTAGTIEVRGVGTLDDSSRGTATVDSDGLMNKDKIANAVWDENVDLHTTGGSSGDVLKSLAFGGIVYVHDDNGVSGTTYPIGTKANPVNNITDARTIADALDIEKFSLTGSFTLDQSFAGKQLVGGSAQLDFLNLNGMSVNGCLISDLTLSGTQNGKVDVRNCTLDGHTVSAYLGLNGIYTNCVLLKDSQMALYGIATFDNVAGGTAEGGIVDLNGSAKIFSMINCTGTWTMKNAQSGFPYGAVLTLEFISGDIIIDSSCIGGTVSVAGVVNTIDNSGAGCIVNRDGQLQASPQAYAGWIWLDTSSSYAGTNYPLGTPAYPVNNFADAYTLATALNIKALKIKGTIVLDRALESFAIFGNGGVAQSIIVNPAGYSINNSILEHITYTGVSSGNADFSNSLITDVTGFHATCANTGFMGSIGMSDAGSYIQTVDCTIIDNPIKAPIFDMIGAGRYLQLNIAGSFSIINMGTGLPYPSSAVIKGTHGKVSLDSSCTGGILQLAGGLSIGTDASTGVYVIDESLDGTHGTGSWEGSTSDAVAVAVWEKLAVDHDTAGTMGALQNTGGAGDPATISAAVWNALKDDYGTPGTMGWLQGLLESGIINKPKIIAGD